jgi:nitrogen fixation/metabolism regulation signal transduction histidine kinase
MAKVNPEHRLETLARDELRAVSIEINRLTDTLQEARGDLARKVTLETAELEIERAKLSAVLDALGEGVVLATVDGRVSLANAAAEALLGGPLLGRQLFDAVDREKSRAVPRPAHAAHQRARAVCAARHRRSRAADRHDAFSTVPTGR